MVSTPALPLPALVDAAASHIEAAVRSALERSTESLALAAATAANALQRDTLLGAEFDLRRQKRRFAEVFHQGFDEQLRRSLRADRSGDGNTASSFASSTAWDELSLVDDHELEIKVQAERLGLQITHACEWELRELEGYMGAILGRAGIERDSNPLRPEIIGHGVIRAIEAVTDRTDQRKAIEAEMARSLASVLRQAYNEIVDELRRSGVQPRSMTVRMTESRVAEPLARAGAIEPQPRDLAAAGQARGSGGASVSGAPLSGRGAADVGSSGFAHTGSRSGATGPGTGTPIGRVDPGLMTLLRRLSAVDSIPGGFNIVDTGTGSELAVAPNLIRAHRDELRQASTGQLDHMVIDVIGSLFDQILSDPKVPPQLARQIARLQLPVLRAALGDQSFFSNRRHPVRQFINRIASLGNGFDDFNDAQAQTFLAKVRELVQEVVQGDFDRIETYDLRLGALERFVAEQAQQAVEAQHAGATRLLQEREDALRLGRQYERRLEEDLQPLAAPAFVRDFVVRVWSRVILAAAQRDGVTSERVRHLRQAGHELFMSVQPKTSAAQRKVFLAELPKLMQTLNEGLNSIGWPDSRRREFFGQLMPAHAEALKSMGRVLDFNLMARQVGQAFERALPTTADLPPALRTEPVADESAAAALTREEAARIGLVDEATFDWNGKVDIEVGVEQEIRVVDLELPGLPKPAEPLEPSSGRSLADQVQIGFSYQMHVDGGWQKVRLAHVSNGRTFFVFSRGQRHQRTISLTYRMLARLCESGRLRAFESAQLLERATARTRRQLAAAGAAATAR